VISKQFQSIVPTLLLSILLGVSEIARAASLNTLYFYSPEVSTSRNTVLKGTFDHYFLQKGQHRFQPVENQNVFEDLLLSHQADALIMSSFHFSLLAENEPTLLSHYVPVLQGEKNGSDVYQRLLVSMNEGLTLQGRKLATSSNALLTTKLLDRIFPGSASTKFENLNILEVPKDIDALMAVGLGLADFALTTNDSLSTLSTLYKEQYSRVRIIGKSLQQKRMVLILSKKVVETGTQWGDLVYSMPESPLGKRALKLLSLDSWRWLLNKGAIQGGAE
jgi:hypothetical protein